MKTVKIGKMPGQIGEFAVNIGDSIKSAIVLAGLDTQGMEVKVDGYRVTDLEGTKVTSATTYIILAEQVKGNQVGAAPTQATVGAREVKVGKMPGQINAYLVNIGDSIASVISLAGLSASGHEVKIDGHRVTDLEGARVTSSTTYVILAEQVKGNK